MPRYYQQLVSTKQTELQESKSLQNNLDFDDISLVIQESLCASHKNLKKVSLHTGNTQSLRLVFLYQICSK
jgi:hypothetical protein